MIYRIHYNWFYCTQFGEVFQVFQVGEDYDDPITGTPTTVISIEYKSLGLLGYAIVHFSNGNSQVQANLNSVLIRVENVEPEGK